MCNALQHGYFLLVCHLKPAEVRSRTGPVPAGSDLVQPQDGLDALVQEVGLPEQTAAVKRHQLLVEVHGEDVEMDASLHVLCLPQGHRAQRASCVT